MFKRYSDKQKKKLVKWGVRNQAGVRRMFFWSKKKKKHSPGSNLPITDSETVTAPEPAAVSESEHEEPAVSPRQFWNSGASVEDWVGQMYQEQLKKGTFDHLAGKGKPIEVPSGDITNSILKNANVLPDWLAMQHDIRDQLHHLLSDSFLSEERVERELEEINDKIKKYNNLVPNVVLQKTTVNKEDIRRQYQQWV
jgi:hypothetical protein